MHKWAIFLGSGTEGFGSLITRAKPAIIETGVLRVAGWLVGCLFFCVDVIDGAQPPIIETGVLRVAGWLVGCLFFCVDLIDGAQQCSVLQAIRGDIYGIIHRHSSCCAGFECWFFSNTINQMLC